jgi:hypothetical protein
MQVKRIELLDPCHYNGNPSWDGDQTLWELSIPEGKGEVSVLATVARHSAFIPAETVAAYVDQLSGTLADLLARALRPSPGRRPQIALAIEPGWEP